MITHLHKHSLSLRERARVRGKRLISRRCCPLNRPSATFSLMEKGNAESRYSSGFVL
jgi:hypothetical protein